MKEKYCKSCNEAKPIDQFYTNGWFKGKRKYKPTCQVCERAEGRRIARETIEEYFGGWVCKKCGFTGHPVQFDCHHIDQTQKEFSVSKVAIRAVNSKKRFIAELEKCTLLCACCHRLEHI